MSEVFTTWGKDSPSGGFALPQFPPDLTLRALMGWEGIIVADDTVDVVDMTREYAKVAKGESCGQCFPCRLGTIEISEILERICAGEGERADMDRLEKVARYMREASRCDIGQTAPRPILDALTHYRDRFLEVIDGGKKVPRSEYLSQVTAPCMSACPAHVDIPGYLEKIRVGHLDEALNLVRGTCCLPGTIGRVCVRECEFKCRRGAVDVAISIKALKRYVADHELTKEGGAAPPKAKERRPERIAVVGAGPAGLSCAYYLGAQGYNTTIFEALPEPGGMAAGGIPDYRLPREILQGEAARVEHMGAEFKYGVKVGTDVTVTELFEDGYSAVFIGAGAPNSSMMGCEGEDAGYSGFMPGVEFLRRVAFGEKPLEGRKILVIGGGNVAMDCVRSALRIGFTDVNLLYRRTEKEMPADPVEIDESKEEGVMFHELVAPVKIIAKDGAVTGLLCVRMSLGEPDASGRRRPVPVQGSEFVMECDAVVPAIGQACEVDKLLPAGVVSVGKTLIVHPVTMQSRLPNIFGGGDCVTGPGTLVAALTAGRRAAQSIGQYIETGACTPDGQDWLKRTVEVLTKAGPEEETPFAALTDRHHPPVADPESRIQDFSEVVGGLTPSQARSEASRCLRCYRIALALVK